MYIYQSTTDRGKVLFLTSFEGELNLCREAIWQTLVMSQLEILLSQLLCVTVRKHPWTMTVGSREGLGLSPPDVVTTIITKLSFLKYFHILYVTSFSEQTCEVGISIIIPIHITEEEPEITELSWKLDPGLSSSKLCSSSTILSCPLSPLLWTDVSNMLQKPQKAGTWDALETRDGNREGKWKFFLLRTQAISTHVLGHTVTIWDWSHLGHCWNSA